jgi:hypothetical protein
MANPADKPAAPADARDPFAWDPDPTVLVSKRSRRFMVPKSLFERAATDRDRKMWHLEASDGHRRPDEAWLTIHAGVTFLGTLSTSWRDLQAAGPGQCSAMPDMSRAVLAQPVSQAQQTIVNTYANKDPATGRLLPPAVFAIFARVVEYLRDEQQPGLWRTDDAFDAPEMMLLPLSEVFSQRTNAGQQANAMVTAAIPVLRRSLHETITPLGVLHDYAIRHRGGGAAAIASLCKAKSAKWQLGRTAA